MAYLSEELMKSYIEDCKKAKSNLEAPLIGEIRTPICKSCKNADYHYGTLKKPECAIYGELPKDYKMAHDYDCPHYDRIPNIVDNFLPKHMRKNK